MKELKFFLKNNKTRQNLIILIKEKKRTFKQNHKQKRQITEMPQVLRSY